MTKVLPDLHTEKESFRKLLKDTIRCINEFEELEHNKSWPKRATDWAAGESAPVEGMLGQLKTLKDVVEIILGGYDDLIQELEKLIILKSSNEQLTQNLSNAVGTYIPDLIELSTTFDHNIDSMVKGVTEKFEENCTFSGEEKKCGKMNYGAGVAALGTGVTTGTATGIGSLIGTAVVSKGLIAMPLVAGVAKGTVALTLIGATGGIALVGAGVGGLVGGLAYMYAHGKGQDRGLLYQKVKHLYDALHNHDVLAKFQAHKRTINSLTKNIRSQITNYQKSFDRVYEEKKVALQREAQVKSGPEGVIQAMELYRSTLNKQIEILATEEPDMNEEMRKRTSKRAAEISCSSFLKGKLDYTDAQADAFVKSLSD